MALDIHGATDEMRKFDPAPPGSVTAAGSGGSASGGMPEGDEFAKAEAAAAEELAKFVTDVQNGFAAFAGVVQSSAADYLQGDGTGADSISQAEQALPLLFQGGR